MIAILAHGHFHILTFSQHILVGVGEEGAGSSAAQCVVIINQRRSSLMCHAERGFRGGGRGAL